jgi:hypothetical protein
MIKSEALRRDISVLYAVGCPLGRHSKMYFF